MKRPTLQDARRMVRQAHPDAKNLHVSWTHVSTFNIRDGYRFYMGVVWVEADGFRSKHMTISRDDEGTWLR